MNAVAHTLDELEVQEYQLKEALRAVLHTILLSRALGPCKPVEVSSALVEVSHARCGDADVDKAVEEGIERLRTSLQPVGPDLARASLVLSFYEHRKKSFFGLTKSTERVYWEQWSLPVLVNLRPREDHGTDAASTMARERRQADLEAAMRKAILAVATKACSAAEHIPPINFSATSPATYPFEISVARPGDSSASWFSRLLLAEPPRLD